MAESSWARVPFLTMRLPQPFVGLPLEVDGSMLAAEVAAVDPGLWRPHPEGAPGNTALPLVALNGDPFDDGTRGPMRPTPYLGQLPYAERVLSALDTVIGRTRLMRIEEEGELLSHVDTNYYWWEHLRVHVPVLTSPDVKFECDGTALHMAAGEVWVFDTWRQHRVVNPASFPRVHLVIDTVGSSSLWNLIEHPDRPAHRIAADGPSAELETESVNYPVVMSPWELERNLDALLEELATVEAGAAARLGAALRSFRHAWRGEWAQHGDAPEGWATFAALRRDADAIVMAESGDTRLPNRVLVSEALRQIVLRPALAEHATPRAAAAAHPGTPPPRATDP